MRSRSAHQNLARPPVACVIQPQPTSDIVLNTIHLSSSSSPATVRTPSGSYLSRPGEAGTARG
ncbi:hypothetical protein C8Q73DRAFT_696902 [Cubamyces lactineus]|nr:hypothetical protein C8Q73DRAFT_696902 [Cubamyces lactineus]